MNEPVFRFETNHPKAFTMNAPSDLLPEESFAANVRRIAGGSLEQARRTLTHDGVGTSLAPKEVHAVRKELKKLRALLRLARAGVGERVFEWENLCCRQAGQALSAARDAAVLVQTFDELCPKLHGLVAPETITSIHEQLLASVAGNEARLDLPAVTAELSTARERITDWPWLHGEDAWRVPGRGVRNVYRRGRRALRRASGDAPADEDFHEWRKQVKLLAAQLRWLLPLDPDALAPMVKELDRLGEWLGEEHDLFVLLTVLAGSVFHRQDTAELEAIRRLLDARRSVLKKKALKHGTRLYRTRPAHFTMRLKNRWKQWRKANPIREMLGQERV